MWSGLSFPMILLWTYFTDIMKNYLVLILTIAIFISCRKPADPVLAENLLSYTHWGTFDVGGECLDLDISDSILVVAANYNGFFVLSIDSANQTLDTLYHETDMDPTVGDNRAERITLSKKHGIIFILDKYDKIWMHKLNGPQFLDNWIGSCTYDVWLSTALDDREDGIGIFTLVKHSSAQSDTSGTVGDYDQYSTSLVWKNLTDINPEDVFSNSGVPLCEYTVNFSTLPSEIHFSNNLLSVTNGELGVIVLKQTEENICVDENGDIIEEFSPTNDLSADRTTCENPPFLGGFNGDFEPEGGFIPSSFSSFDTPGEVKTVFSFENTILAGLSKSNGCHIQFIEEDGSLSNHYMIAQGNSVYGFDYDDDILAIACGHDGILLYEWDGLGLPSLLGRISTSYANKIKVNNNRVFVATEDGIDIFEIER